MTKSPVFFPLSPPLTVEIETVESQIPPMGPRFVQFRAVYPRGSYRTNLTLFPCSPAFITSQNSPPSQPLPPPVLLLALLYLVSSAPLCRRFSLLSLLLALMYRIPSSPLRPSPLSSITLVCSMFHTPTPIRPSWRSLLDFLHLLFPLPNCPVCYFWPLPFSTS